MQSATIDVVLWDDPEKDMTMGSPVSPNGVRFLQALANDKEAGIVEIEIGPTEFARHIPKGVSVIYLSNDGTVMPIHTIQGLQ